MTAIPEVFALIGEWATLNGAKAISETPGLWERDLGEFRVAINPHADSGVTSEGLTVPPYHAVVNAPQYLFAVILVGVGGGIGAADMEADVIAALKADIAALKAKGAVA